MARCPACVRVLWVLLAPLVSLASFICVLVFWAQGVDNNRLFSVFDTRVVTYAEACKGSTRPACAAGAAVSTFVTAIDAAANQCNSSHVKRYSNPTARQTAIAWNDRPAVLRYPVATGLDGGYDTAWLFRGWAPAIYNFDAVAALLWVYGVSLAFQSVRYLIRVRAPHHAEIPPIAFESELSDKMATVHTEANDSYNPDATLLHVVSSKARVSGRLVYPFRSSSLIVPMHQSKGAGLFDLMPRKITVTKFADFSRWVEYALTSSVQILFFALLMQNTSVNQGVLMFSAQLLLCLLGYSVERELEDLARIYVCVDAENPRDPWGPILRLIFLHVSPWVVHYTLWSIIIDDFWRYEKDAQDCIVGLDGAPDAVKTIIYSQGVFFTSFGALQLVHCIRFVYKIRCYKDLASKLTDEINSLNSWIDSGYKILNVFSKFFIAVILVTNLADFSS
jgi:hypothetical protein